MVSIDEETEAANLRPEIRGIEPGEDGYRRRAEQADPGACYANAGLLKICGRVLEARICARAELTFGRIEKLSPLGGTCYAAVTSPETACAAALSGNTVAARAVSGSRR
jgi:hypothetical protein